MLIDYNIDGMRNPYDENWKKGAGGLFDPRGGMALRLRDGFWCCSHFLIMIELG